MLMIPNEDEAAAISGVICLCACVRYWPYCGVGMCASVLKLVLFAKGTTHNSTTFIDQGRPGFLGIRYTGAF